MKEILLNILVTSIGWALGAVFAAGLFLYLIESGLLSKFF